MARPACGGSVETLRDQAVLFTGTTRISGEHRTRAALVRMVEARGGRAVTGTRNAGVTVLALGDLHPDVVTDRALVRSQNAVYVDEQRRGGNHICIVEDVGMSALLAGEPAGCLRSRVEGGDVAISRRPV